jgi:hypothetical protein
MRGSLFILPDDTAQPILDVIAGARTMLRAAVLLALACAGATAHASGERKAEVQINLCSEPREIARRLELTSASANPVEAWYFDSVGLDLWQQGLLFRLRIKANQSELTLKAKRQDCAHLAAGLLPEAQGKCEYDLHGSSLEGAVSLNAVLDDAKVRGLLDGRIRLEEALSAAQIRFLREGVHAWPLPRDLEPLGPARIQAYRHPGRPFVVEVWRLPSGRQFVEISAKSAFDGALRVQGELQHTLEQAGVQACADQSSQARAKLDALLPAR